MAAQMHLGQVACFLALGFLGEGARIDTRSFDKTSKNASGIGPEGEWIKGTKYVCMEKYQSGRSIFESEGKFTGHYCLADYEKAHATKGLIHIHFMQNFAMCQSLSDPWAMKVCSLKGNPLRVSYTTKVHVPKSCFHDAKLGKTYPVYEASVDANECEAMEKLDVNTQGKFGKAPTTTTITTTTTTTITTTTTTTTTTEPIECECEDGFVGEVKGTECSCKPAPCKIVGTMENGPECHCMPGLSGDITWSGETPNGECLAEMKDHFTEGDQKLWEYNGMSVKCCVSTAGEPTELQDMNADELPSEGSLGRSEADPTGCGFMFGDTYQNGLKGRHGLEVSCPVTLDKIMRITGDEEELSLLHLGLITPEEFSSL